MRDDKETDCCGLRGSRRGRCWIVQYSPNGKDSIRGSFCMSGFRVGIFGGAANGGLEVRRWLTGGDGFTVCFERQRRFRVRFWVFSGLGFIVRFGFLGLLVV